MDVSPVSIFIQSLKAAFARDKDKDELAFVDRTGRTSFAQMRKRVEEAETYLTQRLGCQAGDRIAALANSCTDVIALEWATYLMGGIWLGVPARERRPDVIASILSAAQPSVFFLEPGALSAADRNSLLSASVFKAELSRRGENWAFEAYTSNREPSCRRPAESFAVDHVDHKEEAVRIRFTSGATGAPKGIIYSWKTHDAIFSQISEYVLDRLQDRDPNGREVMIHGAPVGWASGSLIPPVFYKGGCNVILPRWDTDEFVRLVRTERCTLTFLAPLMLRRLVKYSEKRGSSWAQSLRNVLVAGAPTPVTTMHRALGLFDQTNFYTTLGMTEASFPITWHQVQPKDVDPHDNPRPFVPVGKIAAPYRDCWTRLGGSLNELKGELMVKGGALAAGKWNWTDPNNPFVEQIEESYPSRDMLELHGEDYQYLCRKDDSCIERGIWECPEAAPDAIESVMQDCEEVDYVRVDKLERLELQSPPHRRIKAHLTIQCGRGEPDDPDSIRKFFDDHRSKANLDNVEIGDVRFGRVAMTQNGKPIRRSNLCDEISVDSPSSANGPETTLDRSLHAQAWTGFDFSLLSSGPLYFYVGSGLSIASGLVGWDEMACMVWRYRRYYEGEDVATGLLKWLDAKDKAERARENARFLQGSMPQEGKEHNAFGRTALLNLILRRRAPRTRFSVPKTRDANWEPLPDEKQQPEERSRYGQEPGAEDFALQSLVWRSNCHGVLTPNYDMFLEHAYSLFNHGSALRSYRYNATFLRYIFSNPRFVLKLHGDINDIGTMLLDPELLWGGEPPHNGHPNDLKEMYKTALMNGHMVYVGARFRDDTIRKLHEYWAAARDSGAEHRRTQFVNSYRA